MEFLLNGVKEGSRVYPPAEPPPPYPNGIIIPHGDDPLAYYIYAIDAIVGKLPAQAIATIEAVPPLLYGVREIRVQLAVYVNGPQLDYWHYGPWSTVAGNLLMDLQGYNCLHEYNGASRVYIMVLVGGASTGMPQVATGVKVNYLGVVFPTIADIIVD